MVHIYHCCTFALWSRYKIRFHIASTTNSTSNSTYIPSIQPTATPTSGPTHNPPILQMTTYTTEPETIDDTTTSLIFVGITSGCCMTTVMLSLFWYTQTKQSEEAKNANIATEVIGQPGISINDEPKIVELAKIQKPNEPIQNTGIMKTVSSVILKKDTTDTLHVVRDDSDDDQETTEEKTKSKDDIKAQVQVNI